MESSQSERHLSRRYRMKAPLRQRIWQTGNSEREGESENLSERGVYFSTDSPLRVGAAVEVILHMPEEITGKPATDWRCTGHVVRVQSAYSRGGRSGVGVEFDCCEIVCSKTTRVT